MRAITPICAVDIAEPFPDPSQQDPNSGLQDLTGAIHTTITASRVALNIALSVL